MGERRRVLFVRRGALGDTLLVAAVLRALRRRSPAGELHVAGVLELAQLLVHAGVADVARSREAFATWSPERAAPQLAGYELVIADDPGFAAVAPAGIAKFAMAWRRSSSSSSSDWPASSTTVCGVGRAA